MKYFEILNRLTKYAAPGVLTMLISISASAQAVSPGFDQPLSEKTVTFEAVNPYSNVAGKVTITVTGTFHGKRFISGTKAGWSSIKGEQQGTFSFVPYDASQPTFTGTFKFGLAGEIPFDRHNDVLPLNFTIKTVGTDGSEVTFVQGELATVNEYGADVSFGELGRSNVVDAIGNAVTPQPN
jgi:hypothetical protein